MQPYVAAAQALPLDPVNDADLARVASACGHGAQSALRSPGSGQPDTMVPGPVADRQTGAGANQIYTNALDNFSCCHD